MQCPGQDNRYWDGAEVFDAPCPHCGNELEFFKDDSQRKCKSCGHKVLNPKMDFGCASYCPHAEQCLGEMPPEMLAKQKDLFKDRLTIAVRKEFADNIEKFKQSETRVKIAQEICQEEEGNMAAIIAASLLTNTESPIKILEKIKADLKIINEAEAILNNTTDDIVSQNIYHDACLLTDMQNGNTIDTNNLITKSGKEIHSRG